MAMVPWSAHPGTNRFSRDAWMNRMAERLRKDCVRNWRLNPQRVLQPQMALMPVATTLLRNNRRQRDDIDTTYDSSRFPIVELRLGVPQNDFLTHMVNTSIDRGFDTVQDMIAADNAKKARLDREARFYERVLNDANFKELLKYWIFDNKHIPT